MEYAKKEKKTCTYVCTNSKLRTDEFGEQVVHDLCRHLKVAVHSMTVYTCGVHAGGVADNALEQCNRHAMKIEGDKRVSELVHGLSDAVVLGIAMPDG